MWEYILARLSEASTWRGIIAAVTAGGMTIEPALATQIVATGLAVIGLLGFMTKDKGASK